MLGLKQEEMKTYTSSTVAASTAALKNVHCRFKKSDNKIIKLQTQIRNASNQNQKQVRLGRLGCMIHKVMIFNSASDNQTYLYAAGQTPNT